MLCMVSALHGDTVGLWRFDTMADVDDASGIGERSFDESGNGLHFTRGNIFGAVRVSSDVPPLAPAGSLSLEYHNTPVFETPLTDLLSIGNTGELTIEFWYKPLLVDTLRFILVQTCGAQEHNCYNLAQAVPANGASPLDVWTSTAPNGKFLDGHSEPVPDPGIGMPHPIAYDGPNKLWE